jgi:pimeloyl-ACP methyl ester carboxylesterase
MPRVDYHDFRGSNGPVGRHTTGFACSGAVWDETVSHYQDKYACYVFNMPGFGGAPAETNPTISGWVDEVATYIKAQHLDHPTIVGHSLGGVMAMMLAYRYPDLIGKVVVVDALPCRSAALNPHFKAIPDPDCSPMAQQMTRLPDTFFYKMEKATMPQLVADSSKIEAIVGWGMHSDRKTYGQIFCLFNNLDLRDSVGLIRCPVLVLLEAGFADSKDILSDQFKTLKGATLVYANKGLHFIMYDDRDWMFGQMDGFVP